MGVMLEMVSVKWVMANMPAMPIPKPVTAVSSGSPAATKLPKVKMRTMAATAIPISSALPPGSLDWKAWPFHATLRSPLLSSMAWISSSRCSSVMSILVLASKFTSTMPVVLSALNGEVAAIFASICSCGIFCAAIALLICIFRPSAACTGGTMESVLVKESTPLMAAMRSLTCLSTPGSVRSEPSGAWMTTLPFGACVGSSSPPLGKRSLILSCVSTDSSPGILKFMVVDVCKVAAAVPMPMMSSSQTAIKRQRWA